MNAATNPTNELLLAACSVDDERRDACVRELVGAGVDWTRLLELARKNRIVPLVHHALRSAGFEAELVARAPHFEEFLSHHQLRSLFLHREQLDLVQLLGAAGIEAVPYKGSFLSLSLYGDLGLRQFYDLDLVVPPEDVRAAGRLLLERGYRQIDGFDLKGATPLPTEDCEIHFRHPSGDPMVELHWDVLPPRHGFGFDMATLWGRLVQVRIGELEVRAFPPEDLLLVLSIHAGEKHRWSRLQMIADVARLLDVHRDLDWNELDARAREIGRGGVILLGVYLAWVLLDAPLPERVRERALAEPDVGTTAALTIGRLLRDDSGLPSHEHWRGYLELLDRRTGERGCDAPPRPRGFFRYLRAAAAPEWTDRQALALPPHLSALYYLYRPWRLWRRHRSRLLGRI